MVVRLEGVVDGAEVIFNLCDDGLWRCTVPAPSLPGTYIIELTAYDDVGNTAYLCRFLATFDVFNICRHLVPLPWYSCLEKPLYYAELEKPLYYAELVPRGRCGEC